MPNTEELKHIFSPNIQELKHIFSREQPSFDTWSHSENKGRSGNVNDGRRQQQAGAGNGKEKEKTNPFEDSSADESRVVGDGGVGGGAPNPFSDSYSMESSLTGFPGGGGGSGMNPFDESVESKVNHNHNHNHSNNNNNNNYHHPSSRPPRPSSRHSWDSDRDFPVMEISRIRTKTKKLRESRNSGGTGVPPKDASASSIFRDDFGAGAEVFSAVPNNATNTTAGSNNTNSVGQGRSVRKNKSWAWSTSDGSASKQSQSQSIVRDSLDEVMNQTTESSTVEEYTHTKATTKNSNNNNNNVGLSRVDEQHSTSVDSTSAAARKAQQNLIQGFHKRGDPTKVRMRPHKPAGAAADVLNTSEPSTEATNDESGESHSVDHKNLTLHDLCGEATATDDIAWRNALYLLSVQPHLASISDEGWTPLHICCLGQSAAPSFMIRALLYCNRGAPREVDEGDRLPLHLVAASSGDVELMQLLVDEYPQSVYQRDSHGQTALHLLIRNLAVELTADKARVLLGLTLPESADLNQQKRVLQRRGEHLELRLEELDRMLTRTRSSPPVSTLERDRSHEASFSLYPEDVQMALKKLEQWKKRQRKEGLSAAAADEAVEVEFASADGETNPAAIPMAVGTQLPIHMLVRRAIVNRAPIESSSFFDKDEEKIAGDEDEEAASDAEVSSERPRPSVPNIIAVLRLFAAAYPEGLVLRDARGLTPLLTALLVKDSLPNIKIVEILLGKRSLGYESPPDWAQDMPLHRISGAKYMNPAMVPVLESNQLPLHVASEEMLSNYLLMESIHESYPGAVQIQDSTGKTPLHLALSNYRGIPVDPRVLSLLLTDRVAQTRDDDGNLPFDLLLENAQSLPLTEPRAWSFDDSSGGRTVGTDASPVYERFFSLSILGQGRPNNPSEAKLFLDRLGSLPVWLRREACTASFVQELLIEELSSPWKCAYVLFDGFLLGFLICLFRIGIKEFVDSIESGDALSWYTYAAVYVAATTRLILQAVLWAKSASLAEFQQAVLLNGWSWIDGAAMLSSIVTSVLLYGAYDLEILLTLATVSTGLLWLSLIGYFASWWYGMAVLTGALSKIACRIVWPALVAGALLVAFAQMFYTLLQIDCADAIAVTAVCSVRDSYRVVYLLMRGEVLVGVDGSQEMSLEAITLVALFLFFFALLLLALFVTILIAALQFDFEEIALGSYWEPRLASILSMNELGYRRSGFSYLPSCGQRLMTKFELAWDLMMISLVGGQSKNEKYWYASSSRSSSFSWPLWMLSIFVVPIWFILGCATFGLLWPPQLRRIIFRPVGRSNKVRKTNMAAEDSASQVSRMRNEIMQLKAMSYDRSSDVHMEIRDLKELLLIALREE